MGTKERTRTPLPFGGGIDRASGLLVVEPAAFSDLRNVHLRRGKASLRKGLLAALTLAGETDILGIFTIRSQGLGAVVTYNTGANEVRLYAVNGAGTTSSYVGVVWALSAGAEVPRVVGDDSYDRLFLAHDTPSANSRLVTRVYNLIGGTISDLTGDLDGGGAAPIRFRGVRRHLEYLVGWGFGADSDKDRPEIGRVSMPGDPMTFNAQHYFLAGQRGDPIVDCRPAGSVLAVRKESESYDFVGTDRATFGIVPADHQFGQAGSRLGVTVGRTNYFWSLEGPRQGVGGETIDLSVLLDLAGPVPDALADDLDFDAGFAVYEPSAKEILFVFGRWAFVLHIEDPSTPRWSYRELHVDAKCGGVLYEGAASTLAEATLGALSMVSLVYAGDPEPTAIVPWTISGSLSGGELVEIWVKTVYGGAGWELLGTAPAGDLTANQILHYFLTNTQIAIRVTLGGIPGAGYTGSPDTWPATSRSTINSAGTLQYIQYFFWSRRSALRPAFLFDWAGPGMGGTHPELSWVLEKSTNAGASWSAAAGSPFSSATLYGELTNADVNVTTARWRLKIVGPDADTGFVTNNESDFLFQPKAPSGLTAGPDLGGVAGGHMHHCSATNNEALAAGVLELRARHLPVGLYSGFLTDSGSGVDLASNAGTPGTDDGNLELTARVTVTAFAVNDRTSIVQDMGML